MTFKAMRDHNEHQLHWHTRHPASGTRRLGRGVHSGLERNPRAESLVDPAGAGLPRGRADHLVPRGAEEAVTRQSVATNTYTARAVWGR